jgi:DNA helicase IV
MQWSMLVRRCPTRSFTVVGDIDQAEAPHRASSWSDALRPAFGERWTPAHLTICYRTPDEVMALTGEVLERAGSGNRPPRSVRITGLQPWTVSCPEGALAGAVRESVRILRARYEGGTVAVISTPQRLDHLRASLDEDVPVLVPSAAKGLEFDATVVVDPDGIAGEPRGWNALYVALTRCTQELGQIRPLRTEPGIASGAAHEPARHAGSTTSDSPGMPCATSTGGPPGRGHTR